MSGSDPVDEVLGGLLACDVRCGAKETVEVLEGEVLRRLEPVHVDALDPASFSGPGREPGCHHDRCRTLKERDHLTIQSGLELTPDQ